MRQGNCFKEPVAGSCLMAHCNQASVRLYSSVMTSTSFCYAFNLHLLLTLVPSLCNFREKPTEDPKAETSKTSKVQPKPATAAANLDPDDLFDDI